MKGVKRIGIAFAVLMLNLSLLPSWPAAITRGQDGGMPVPLGEVGPPPAPARSGSGPDAVNTRALTDQERQHKRRMRHLADRWADVLQWDTLDGAERARLDGVVRSQVYWIAFGDNAVDLPSVAQNQLIPVIIELDAPPDAETIATLSHHVARLRYVFRIVDAVAVDLSLVQLADVVRLPHVRHVWPDAPVQFHLDRSVEQIGAHAIHAAGLTGDGVKVAVVDKGIQDDHPVLDGRVVAERYDEDDGNHATHVAGIIAASGDLTGVAPDDLYCERSCDIMTSPPSGIERWIANENAIAGPLFPTGLQGVCLMNSSPIDLADLFAVARQAVAEHQQEINDLDGYNGNHGDNMTENMQLVVDALQQRRGQPPAAALEHASQRLQTEGRGGTIQYYAKGLERAAAQVQGRSSLTKNDALSVVQSLLGSIPSQGYPQAEEQQPGSSVLDQVLGMSQAQPAQQQKADSPLGGLLKSVVPAALAFLQAKQSGADTSAAASQALMGALTGTQQVNPLQSGTPRTAAGGLVAQALLNALAGRG